MSSQNTLPYLYAPSSISLPFFPITPSPHMHSLQHACASLFIPVNCSQPGQVLYCIGRLVRLLARGRLLLVCLVLILLCLFHREFGSLARGVACFLKNNARSHACTLRV